MTTKTKHIFLLLACLHLHAMSMGKEFGENLIANLQTFRNTFGDEIGTFDRVIVEELALENGMLNLDDYMSMVRETNGDWILNINTATLYGDVNLTFAAYEASIKVKNVSGTWVPKNLKDMLNHEFGHRLTMVKADTYSASLLDDFNEIKPSLGFLNSQRALVDGDEALAEIYAAFKQGKSIPLDVKNFFNTFSIDEVQIP